MVLTTINTWQILPRDPIASGSFMNIATNNAADGVYTLNGSTVAITDIIDTSATEGTPSELLADFNPNTDIDADGIVGRTNGPILTLVQSLQDQLFASGFTVVFDVVLGSIGVIDLHILDWDGSFSGHLKVTALDDSNAKFEMYENANNSDTLISPVALDLTQIQRVAMTVLDSRMALSVSGGAVTASENPGFTAGTDTITFALDDGTQVARLRSFAFYEAVADADLPALSAL